LTCTAATSNAKTAPTPEIENARPFHTKAGPEILRSL
jgi:hypothetical protein